MGEAGVSRARVIQVQGLLDVLRHVHEHPSTTRAELARGLGLSRGSAAEIVGRLTALSLVEENDVEPTGRRGRPTRALGPHPAGPAVAVADISHESWRLAIAGLGGALEHVRAERHDRDAAAILRRVGDALARTRAALGDRLRAIGIAVPGTVDGGRVLQAVNLGWDDIDFAAALDQGIPMIVGNDATLAGVAEARRGAALGTELALSVTIEVGIGGVLLDRGRPITGGTGTGGEFGHLPFGDPALRCPCGARGCWDLDVDGRAMARLLGHPEPADPRTEAGAILARAAAGDAAARDAVGRVAANVGRGLAGLVNALNPEVVVLTGLGPGLLGAAAPELSAAYLAGLMRFRRAAPPPLVTPRFPADGRLLGAADLAFDTVLSESGLDAWTQEMSVPAGRLKNGGSPP